MDLRTIRQQVATILQQTPIFDIHTHLYSEQFGKLLRWGIDELLTYHYLVAELFRYRPNLEYREYWALPQQRQAELIWDEIFVKHTPISEAALGVVTTLQRLGIDACHKDLDRIRGHFARCTPGEYIDRIFELANVSRVVMTNDPFDPAEQRVWSSGGNTDSRFMAALRLDRLLNDYPNVLSALDRQGFRANAEIDRETAVVIKDFLRHWIERMNPVYMAVSLPPDFRMDNGSQRARLITDCVLPVARESDLPLAMMIGVKKGTNPALGDAGDSVGKTDITVLEALAREYPDIRFLVTMLSRENQHELCVACRKFGNVLPFGCWWFLNTPSIMREITAERIELLGLTMIPQHSDARVLDQLIYKWEHSRKTIVDVLAERYFALTCAGWIVSENDIRGDAQCILGGQLLDL